jgi:steroid 5-alpha reductase family enzyme
MTFLSLYAICFVIVLLYVTAIWLLSLVRKNASIMDIFWGLGFALVSGLGLALADGFLVRRLLVFALVAIWAARLSLYIFSRNWGRPEDYRYRAWRKASGASFWWVSFFKVFMFQGVLLSVIAAPLLVAQSSGSPDKLTVFDLGGTGIWAIGFFFEAVGDWQLARFKDVPENQGKVMRTGLWAYTRHPNYFGDVTLWWGLFLIALGTPAGFWSIVSPVVTTVLLLRVTGVSLLERGLAKTKPDYKEYIESTSAFFPRFPRK